jgi:hypothetical protein
MLTRVNNKCIINLIKRCNVEKVIRDGKVAVVYSPGFGAGWSTWAHSGEGKNLLFDPMIVNCVENGDKAKLATYMAMRYPDVYTGGMEDLRIEWLPEGTLFRIHEYDGSESIEVKEEMDWVMT